MSQVDYQMKTFGFKKLRVRTRAGDGPLRSDDPFAGRPVLVFVVDRVLPDRTANQWEAGWLVETGPTLRLEDGAAWFVSQDTGLVYDEENEVVGISRHIERIAAIELAREQAQEARWADEDPDEEQRPGWDEYAEEN